MRISATSLLPMATRARTNCLALERSSSLDRSSFSALILTFVCYVVESRGVVCTSTVHYHAA